MESNEQILNHYGLLIIKHLAGDISDNELQELQDWINQSENNKEIFHRFRSAWVLAGISESTGKYNTEEAYLAVKSKMSIVESGSSEPVKLRLLANLRKYAAVGLICFALGGILMWFFQKPATYTNLAGTVISTPLGAKSTVDLPDGTKVWLNAGSKLKYDNSYGKTDRSVILEGEAYFDVAKNKHVPFLVKTSQLIIKALGTRFNVKAYHDERTITATLEEGKIEVATMDKSSKINQIILNPSESVVYYLDGNQMQMNTQVNSTVNTPDRDKVPHALVSRNVKTALYTSWKDDKWVLEGIRLGDLGILIERRYNVTMVFNDAGLRNFKFTGTIENQTLEQILNAFKFTAPVDYKIKKDTVFLNLNTSQADKFKFITGE